jgi:hypothetical protein
MPKISTSNMERQVLTYNAAIFKKLCVTINVDYISCVLTMMNMMKTQVSNKSTQETSFLPK